MDRNKRIPIDEFKYRVSEFKDKIMYIKRKNKELKISYDPKVLEDLINLDNKEFNNLLDELLDLKIVLYRNAKLKEMNFIYRLWKLKLEENKLILISKNHYSSKKAEITINLLSKEKQITISYIDSN